MEWGTNGSRSHTFTYTISGNKINVEERGDTWQVVSLSSDKLTLRWYDDGYSIVCTFKADYWSDNEGYF